MKARWAVVGLSILLAALLGMTGSSKIFSFKESVRVRDQLGMSARSWPLIGALEYAAVAGFILGLGWAPAGMAASVGLMGLMVGAAVSRARVSAGAGGIAVDVIVLLLAALLLYLHATAAPQA